MDKKINPIMIKGLHLDISRHFLPCNIILEIIKKMKELNFNTLHLHLSDDPSFPVESKKYPQIKFPRMLSIKDQELIAAACKDTNIEIIPEIDIPGHLTGFLHIFRKDQEVFESLGGTPPIYLDIEKELPIIFDLYEEYATRFNSKYIHMGGDEAGSYTEFPKLVTLVCQWAKEKKLKVIAWDEVGEYIKDDPLFNETLILHRWRGKASIAQPTKIPYILSYGYYLDHMKNPIDYYNSNPEKFGPNLGCIACTWTESINENNIWCTIFPTLYMLSLRWNEYPVVKPHLPVVLYELCEKYGYPQCFKKEFDESWKVRSMGIGIVDTIKGNLDVYDRYHYPIMSKKLIKTQWILYRHCVQNEKVDEKELDIAIEFIGSALGKKPELLKEKKSDWKSEISKLLFEAKMNLSSIKSKLREEGKDYNNGILRVFEEIGIQIK